jgi:hypothetical protein
MIGGKPGQRVAKELEMTGPNSVFSWAIAGAAKQARTKMK